MLLNIILSDFQQYRTLLAKVIHFFVSLEKCENQRYKLLTPDQRCVPQIVIILVIVMVCRGPGAQGIYSNNIGLHSIQNIAKMAYCKDLTGGPQYHRFR